MAAEVSFPKFLNFDLYFIQKFLDKLFQDIWLQVFSLVNRIRQQFLILEGLHSSWSDHLLHLFDPLQLLYLFLRS